jgi:hypothetical protein
MTVDEIIAFFSSPFYRSLVSLLIAISLVAIAALLYFAATRRINERLEVDRGSAPWNLIIATTLDSFLITLFYSAETLFYTAANFARDLSPTLDSPLPLLPLVSGVFGLFMQLAIAWIAMRRVIKLHQWLNRRGPEPN